MKRKFYIILILALNIIALRGQETDTRRFVQVSGIITDASYRPVAGVSVVSKKLRRATVSEPTGIYSITSTPGDTVYFRALGFKRYHTVIPYSYTDRHANVDIVLEPDTINIEAVNIMPWKSYSEFLRDITKERPVDPLIENMNENIASIYVAIANETNITVSPESGYRYAMEQNFNAAATRNQFPANNLLNPFAWAKFINGIKNGMLKNQKISRPSPSKVRKKKYND
ncbi:MAG TPA: carboxypeptidase-like regulatory domain-containing protein [Bacteroidales bacterium]|nr:carboxypeptidase-like regulatory domain-containing protein [Bacteroidales bacterium]